MKSYMKIIVAVVGLAAICANASTTMVRCTTEESARYGATHVVNLDYSDLAACTSSNQTVAFTNTVSAPCSVKFVAYQLDSAFAATLGYTNGVISVNTTNVGSIALTFAGGGKTWISSVQAAWAPTPTVYGSFGTDYTVATSGPATNALTSTVTSPILDSQSSDVTAVVTVVQSGASAQTMSSLTSGHARFFIRVLGQKYRN